MKKVRIMRRSVAVLLVSFWFCLPQLGVFGFDKTAFSADESIVVDDLIANFPGLVRAEDSKHQTPPGTIAKRANPRLPLGQLWFNKACVASDRLAPRHRLYKLHRVFLI